MAVRFCTLYQFYHPAITVDDIALDFKIAELMNLFISNISATFEVKLYDELKFFIRWNVTKLPTTLYVKQASYAERQLHRFCMLI